MTIYLSLGSNRGPRRANIEAALRALPAAGVAARRVSALIETRPVGMRSRAPFLNCVVEGETALSPRRLLLRLLRAERSLGRHRGHGGGKTPRAIDIDLILYGRIQMRSRALTLPHPRFAGRGFVLAGLAELAPHLVPPGGGVSARQLLRRVKIQPGAAMSDRIEKQVLLRAPRAQVWRALTDSRQFGQWFLADFPDPFVAGAAARGKITHPGYEHLAIELQIDRIAPEHFFSWRWHPYAIDPKTDYSAEPATLVAFELEEAPEGTRLKITESGFDQLPAGRRAEAYRMDEQGWTQQMVNIARHVEPIALS